MALNKQEKQFRESLNNRQIVPSAQAWDRLDAMLTVSKADDEIATEKTKNKFNWLLFAACYIGFVFVLTFFVITKNENTSPIIQNPIVQQKINQENIKKVQEKQVANSENLEITTKKNSALKNKKQEKIIAQVGVSIIKNNQNLVLKDVKIKQQEVLDELPSNNQKTAIAIIENKIASLENDILNPNIFLSQPKKITINANSLLSQADDEVRQERQRTIFQKIGTNIQAVKVAFNERNLKK